MFTRSPLTQRPAHAGRSGKDAGRVTRPGSRMGLTVHIEPAFRIVYKLACARVQKLFRFRVTHNSIVLFAFKQGAPARAKHGQASIEAIRVKSAILASVPWLNHIVTSPNSPPRPMRDVSSGPAWRVEHAAMRHFGRMPRTGRSG